MTSVPTIAGSMRLNERIAGLFPGMSEADFAEFRADVEANGLLAPITAWRDEVVDGRHRSRACAELGIEPRYTFLDPEWDEARVVQHVVSLNLHRRHLDTTQRGLIGRRLVTTTHGGDRSKGSNDPLMSVADAASLMNVSEPTIKRAGRVMAQAPELVPAMEQGEVTIAGALTIVEEAPELVAAVAAGEVTATEAVDEARERKKAHVAANSGQNEWYTPDAFLDAARIVMGGIDVDPASSDIAQARVQAATYYTVDRSGLDHPWRGRIWMNPPYAQPLIGQFIEKLAADIENGNATEAIVLVNNGTETAWGQTLLRLATSTCFPARRIRFLDPDGNLGAPLQGQMIAYYGQSPHLFDDAFGEFGEVLHG